MSPLAASDVPAAPVLIVMAIGVVVAALGHASKSRALVVAGLMMLFLATAAMVVGAYVAYESDPNQDPRPRNDPKVPNF
jgi:4-hydroxybenzoate polyprenyltransferase